MASCLPLLFPDHGDVLPWRRATIAGGSCPCSEGWQLNGCVCKDLLISRDPQLLYVNSR